MRGEERRWEQGGGRRWSGGEGVRDKAVVSSFFSFDFFIFCQTCANACVCFPSFFLPPLSVRLWDAILSSASLLLATSLTSPAPLHSPPAPAQLRLHLSPAAKAPDPSRPPAARSKRSGGQRRRRRWGKVRVWGRSGFGGPGPGWRFKQLYTLANAK